MQNKTITVKGIGTASVNPDYVIISLHLKGEDKEYVKAVDKANEKIEKLKRAIVSVGFKEDDLKTLNFSAKTVYKSVNKGGVYSQQFSHYSSNYDLTVSFDFTSKKLSDTLTAIADSGSDASFSIDFSVKEPQNIKDELLASAAENARHKAEVLCKASGKQLGELVSINYDWNTINVVSHSNYAVASAGAELTRGVSAPVPEFTPDLIDSQDSATFVWEIV